MKVGQALTKDSPSVLLCNQITTTKGYLVRQVISLDFE
jgi:hypothetical protein